MAVSYVFDFLDSDGKMINLLDDKGIAF